MTIYQCYRCGYESHIKTIIVRHINRKNICKPKVNNINLDDCKEYILNGFSYKEYCEKVTSSKMDQLGSNRFQTGSNRFQIGSKGFQMGLEDKDSDNSIKSDLKGNLICEYCNKKFLKKEYLEKHLKKNCKMLINFNNIFEFDKDTLGQNIYKGNKDAGEIYIIQTDYINNDHYKIGISINIKKRLGSYRCGSTYEPRLHYYFPCPNVKEIDKDLNTVLLDFRVKNEIFKGELEIIKSKIIDLISSKFNIKGLAYEPNIKLGDLTQCTSCNKCFYTSKDLNYHFNTCKEYQEELNRKNYGKFECKYCERSYNRKDNLTKHLKTCKEKKKDDSVKESMEELVRLLNEKENQLKESQKEKEKEKERQLKDNEKKDRQLAKILSEKDKQLMEELKKRDKQIEELIKKAGIVNSNNVTNNIQNNFKLLNYKETDTSHLTENDYVKCLEHYNFCVPHLIRKIHFNPKKPENHNIYISNLKNSYVMIYMNNKWKVKNRDETISRMIDDKQIILEKKIQEWVESGIQYPKVMAKFSRYIEKREENDVINAIKEDIKLMLYNNRNMIVESRKLLKSKS